LGGEEAANKIRSSYISFFKNSPSHNTIRWASNWLLEKFILDNQEKLVSFAINLITTSAAEKEKTATFITTLQNVEYYVQLATRVLVGEELSHAIYALEGDGAMIFVAKEIIEIARDSLAGFTKGETTKEKMDEFRKKIDHYTNNTDVIQSLLRNVAWSALLYLNEQLATHSFAWITIQHVNSLCHFKKEIPILLQLTEGTASLKLKLILILKATKRNLLSKIVFGVFG